MKFFHEVQGKVTLLEFNLKKALKLTTKVLDPRNCKQSIATALVIFQKKTTAADVQYYFPDEKSTIKFLKLFSNWWVM